MHPKSHFWMSYVKLLEMNVEVLKKHKEINNVKEHIKAQGTTSTSCATFIKIIALLRDGVLSSINKYFNNLEEIHAFQDSTMRYNATIN